MRKVVISGGPFAGKTTLLRHIKQEFPEFNYIPEPASVVLSEHMNGIDKSEHWKDIFDSALTFCTLCIRQSIILESKINPERNYSFQDRSLIDTIAYARRDGCQELIPTIRSLARLASYDAVLFCEPVGVVANRMEDPKQAELTHSLLEDAYLEAGMKLFHIPALPTEDRMELVKSHLGIVSYDKCR